MTLISRFAIVMLFLNAVAVAKSNPVPLVDQPLVPDAATPGAPAFTLTVHGSGFVSNSEVRWNGTVRSTHFVGSTVLTARIRATDVAKAGTASVTVANTAPGGGVSNVTYFQIITPARSISFHDSTFGAGQEPYAVASGDFNRDGKIDLAVANVTGGTVSILLGNGDGTFKTQTQIAAGYGPIALAVGDFNGDGKLDLAVANNGNKSNGHPGTVTMLLGNGRGGFRTGGTFKTGDGPFTVVAGDFNGDGKLDLAFADYNVSVGNSVAVLLGKGNGTFQKYVSYPTGAAPIGLATEDLNGDGILDLVTANEVSQTASVLLGNGDGTFKPHVDYPVGRAPLAVAIGDFNHDNRPDVAVANLSDNTVSVLLGRGDGTFKAHVDYATGNAPVAILVADLNADHRQDLVVVNQGGNSLSILLGKGNGSFKPHVDFSTGPSPQGAALGDFNRDGRLDLSVVDVFSNVVEVVLQTSKDNAPLQ
jgi:hypothetical protein